VTRDGNRLRIGVNLLYLRPGAVGGSEVYVRNVIERLTDRLDTTLTLFCSVEAGPTFADAGARVVTAASGEYRRSQRVRDENLGLLRHLDANPVDVLWSPGNFAAPLLPRRLPQVVTVHDLRHHWLPQYYPLATRFQRSALFATSVARARRVITVSEFTRRDVMRRYRVPASTIVTVHQGVRQDVPGDDAAAETVRRLGLTPPFFVYPAAALPHKNHRRLIESFGRFIERTGSNAQLVLCGAQGDVWDYATRRISAQGLESRVRHLGFLPRREDVFLLLRRAEALVFPSEFEGFGLPLVEAQKVGTPVIASNAGSIPEVVGQGALLLDPMDVEGWARAMERVTTDGELREMLTTRGTENVDRFSWERCAEQTLDVLRAAS